MGSQLANALMEALPAEMVEALEPPPNTERAGETVPANQTLDGLADATLNRIAQFFGECVSDESFCGFSVDEKRGQSGELLSLTLVPCDTVAGESVRRVGR